MTNSLISKDIIRNLVGDDAGIKGVVLGALTGIATLGGTFDAFLSRLKGNKAKNSNVIFETIFFILNAPLMLPLLPFTKKTQIK